VTAGNVEIKEIRGKGGAETKRAAARLGLAERETETRKASAPYKVVPTIKVLKLSEKRFISMFNWYLTQSLNDA